MLEKGNDLDICNLFVKQMQKLKVKKKKDLSKYMMA